MKKASTVMKTVWIWKQDGLIKNFKAMGHNRIALNMYNIERRK